MKNWCIGCILFLSLLLLGSCKSHNGCKGKGGGWYGDRNLSYNSEGCTPDQSHETKKISADCESVEP